MRTYGFGFEGGTFKSFAKAIAERIEGDLSNIPECIAVHRQNYLCVNGVLQTPEGPDPHCLLIDFSRVGLESQGASSLQGLATGHFHELFERRVKEDFGRQDLAQLVSIVEILGIPPQSALVVKADGVVQSWPFEPTGFAPKLVIL